MGQIRGEVGALLRRALTQITSWVAFFASYQRDRLISTGPRCAKLVQSLDLRSLGREAGKSDKIGHSRRLRVRYTMVSGRIDDNVLMKTRNKCPFSK